MNPWLRNMKWNNTDSIYKVGCGFAQMQAALSCLCLSAHLLWCSSVSHPSQVSFSRCGEQLWKSDLFSSHYTFSLFHGVWSTGFLLVFPLWNVHRICHLLSCSLLDAGKLNSQRSIFTWAYGSIQRGKKKQSSEPQQYVCHLSREQGASQWKGTRLGFLSIKLQRVSVWGLWRRSLSLGKAFDMHSSQCLL